MGSRSTPTGRPPRHTSGVLALATILAFIGGLLVGGAAVGIAWFARSAPDEPPYESAADVLPAELPNLIDEEGDVSAAADVLRPWAERTGGELEKVDEGDAAPGLVLESCTE